MRCALIEAETREEILREMDERMRKMEAMYSRRLMSEVKIVIIMLRLIIYLNPVVGAERAENRCQDRHDSPVRAL